MVMIMDAKDIDAKFIRTAEQMEMNGLKFYSDALKKSLDMNSRGLLEFLVIEEKQHLSYFKSLENRRPDESKVKPLKTPLFKKDAYKKVGSKRSLTLSIFNTALEMEEKGIKYYTMLAKRSKSPKTRKFLLMIADMEKQHFKLIKMHEQAIYDAWYWQAMEMPALNQ
jgi:rubrerythrin